MDVRKVFQYALQREHEGERFFQQNATRMSHAAATEIFNRLADEESKHIRFIESLLSSLEGVGEPDPTVASQLNEGSRFIALAKQEMLDQTITESMVPDISVLRVAYLIERDFKEFYQNAASKAEGEAREALSMLARWEFGHEQLFKDLHDTLFEEYAQMPWGG
jgi:rubrerythrin